MDVRGWFRWLVWVAAVLAPWCVYAQAQGGAQSIADVDAAGNSLTVEAALHQISDRAAIVFVGTVADVHRSEGSTPGAGTVEIRFDVEQAIRGLSGTSYTLREWGGLWSANDTRFRIGQRLLLLLHAPGASGLSSPVGGMDGAIPLRSSGSGIRSGDASTAVAEQVADLRWIGARLSRPVIYRNPKTPQAPPVVRARSVGAASGANALSVPAAPAATVAHSVSDASTPAQEAAVSTLIGMLRSWEVRNGSAR